MMNDQDIYDMQDYPEMPASWEFLLQIERLMKERTDATMALAEIAGAIIAAVERMDPALRRDVRRECYAILDHRAGRRPTPDYVQLKADLDRSSAMTRQLLAEWHEAQRD